MSLTNERISELANQEDADHQTVMNWLTALLTRNEPEDKIRSYLAYDTKVFHLSISTVLAIERGIHEHFHGR